MTEVSWRGLARSGRLGAFVVLCLGVWLHAADSFLVATTMPVAVTEIGGLAWINWAVALYQLAGIVSGAATALAARRRGLRAVLLGAATAYGAGCVASALSPNMAIMLAGRLVQGAGGGMMIALTYVATQRLFPSALWTRLMAIVSAIWGGAALIGPLIGGVFADAGLWRGAFWAFAAQAGLLVLLAGRRLRNLPEAAPVPASAVTGGAAWPARALALLSAATLAIAVAGVAEVGAAVVLVAAGLALLAMAVRADASHALFPSGLPRFDPVGRGLMMLFLLAAGSMPFTAYGPLLANRLFGASATGGGALLALESVTWTIGTLCFAAAPAAWEGAIIRAGTSVVVVGGVILALAVPGGQVWAVVLGLICLGGGFGAFWPFIVKRLASLAPAHERDLTASATSTVQRLGYALGASAAGIAANATGLPRGETHAAALAVFAAAVPVLLAGVALVPGEAGGPP